MLGRPVPSTCSVCIHINMNLEFYTKRFDRRVIVNGITVGAINPMVTKAGKWAYLPSTSHWSDVPEPLRQPIYRNTIGEIQAYIRRQLFQEKL